jgi:putative transposase
MTQPVTFEPHARYVLHGSGYQVLQLLDDGTLVVRNLTTNALMTHRLTELWQAWQDNTLEFAREGPNLHHKAETTLKTAYNIADLAELPTQLQNITWHRYQLLLPLIPMSSSQRTKQVIEERIQTYLFSPEEEKILGREAFLLSLAHAKNTSAQQEASAGAVPTLSNTFPQPPAKTQRQSGIPSQLPPHLTSRTVARWLHRYQESHGDIRSLVPSYHQRGPQHHRLNPVIEKLLQQAIKQTYLANVRAPITHVITAFEALLLSENAQRSPEVHLSPPGKMTIYRYINQLDTKEVDRARNGPRKAERDHHQSYLGPRPKRPNQRAEFDFAHIDMLVVDTDDRLPIGKPTIAAIRDKATGYPTGIFISFEPPSYRLVMDCLLYAIVPKTHVKDLFQTQHEYLAFGVPEVLVVDNAIELHRDLELACLQLGIELQHMPVRTPWFKGSIERWFRTLNTDLIHTTPGTTFSNFLERGEYQSQKNACITLDRLWELLHLWVVDVYTQDIHRGIGTHPPDKGIPARLWQQALEQQFVPCLPPSRKDLLVLISRNTARTVHHYGIEFENLVYQDHQLATLRSELAKAKRYHQTPTSNDQQPKEAFPSNRLPIKYHPGDLSRIWVFDPFSHRYLEIPAVDQQYTENLSLWKHRVIKRYAQEELKSQVDHEALVLAKTRIQQLIAQEMRVTRKIRSRQSMARWLNYQVTTWMTDSSSTDSVPSGSSSYPPTLPAENTHRKNKRQSEPLEASLLLASASDAIPPHRGTSSEADLSVELTRFWRGPKRKSWVREDACKMMYTSLTYVRNTYFYFTIKELFCQEKSSFVSLICFS